MYCAQLIVIEGANEGSPPVFEGRGEAWHQADCSHVVLRNIHARKQWSNGARAWKATSNDKKR